ncbi:cupredoxin domain-containing protein [Streptomyces sp. SR27]|uniref:cupredoxin domain-containing protein n=1 Tax=unclassified Streptomyces TaxID=2593676 RepID=UPI00295BDE3A|nr:cupredoxin domain-containing protein [Streptomyces sp. SR27]MDV9187457.1 cupredoxin domain-containing protein [Streptomyces sp. SR27]
MALGLAAGGLTGLLAACGSGGGSASTAPPAQSTAPPAQSSTAGTTQVTADLSDFHIALSQQTYKAGGYTFVVNNIGHHVHALAVEGPGGENRSQNLDPGKSTKLTVTLKSGKYEIYCPVDGHKDLGMKTEITVGGAGGAVNESPTGNGY